MESVFTVVFIALVISAPWVSRKWDKYGALAWFIISVVVMTSALALLK
ncbi:MAG: hypothetical protein MUP11_09820 [Anaerolineales bacterium]|nr:hypothetical protein [Anaerolineales bacterium]